MSTQKLITEAEKWQESGEFLLINGSWLTDINGDEGEPLLSAKIRRRRKCRDVGTLLVFLLATAITNVAYSLINPFFPNVAKDKGASPITVGLIIGAAPFWVAVLSPVIGFIFNILGARLVVFLGLLLVGTAYILLAFIIYIPNPWLFILVAFLLRTVEGVGTAMFKTASFSRLPALFPKSIGTIIGLIDMAGGIGFSLGFPLGGALFELGGYLVPFFVVGIPILLMIIPCVLLLRKSNSTNMKSKVVPMKSMCSILTDAIFILLFINAILAFASLALMQPTLEPYLIANFNLTPALVGLTSFIAALTFFLSAFPVGLISDRMGHRRTFSITGTFLIVLSCFILSIPYFTGESEYWYIIASFIIMGIGMAFGMITVFPDMINRARKKTKNEVDEEIFTPFVSGLASSGLNFGEFLGSLLGGILTEFISFPLMALVFAEVALAQTIMLTAISVIDHFIK